MGDKMMEKDIEFYNIINEILEHEEFTKRKDYKHHGDISVYDHSLAVSKMAYKMAKFIGCNKENAAIGGILHDFYYEPWQENIEKKPLLQKHGFTHANEALVNSQNYFPHLLNKKIENSIKRHMFPLNKIPPRYLESWIVTMSDKIVSLEVFLSPTKIPMLFGLRLEKEE